MSMEVADVFVALGNDRGNTVPKRVTVPEIRVLQAIHGDEAVFDIRKAGQINVDPRLEMSRLRENYPAKDSDGRRYVDTVFPGSAPYVPATLLELELPDALYAPLQRATPMPPGRRGRPPVRRVDTDETVGAPTLQGMPDVIEDVAPAASTSDSDNADAVLDGTKDPGDPEPEPAQAASVLD